VFIAILRAGIFMEFTERLRGFTLRVNLHKVLVQANFEIFYIFTMISNSYTPLHVKIESVCERVSLPRKI
jgi:hypothetical protein